MAGLVCFASIPFPHITKLRPIAKTHHFLPTVPTNFPSFFSRIKHSTGCSSKGTFFSITLKASVGSADYVVEQSTDIKFEKELTVPGCPDSLVLVGTGYREKVFAIIGVKVYAAGFYARDSVGQLLESWKGKSADQFLEDSSLFTSIFHAPLEKSLKIMLVRDVDGKTFWNALNDVISPRIKEPTTVDESALSTFCNTFQDRDLKKGTIVILTWKEPSKMLVSISSDRFPTNVDAEIESVNVTMALFDGFFGESPVSPTLKASVCHCLAGILI